MADAAWKAADYGKDGVVVSDVLSYIANDGECMMKSFIAPVLKFQPDMKFLFDVPTLIYTLVFKVTNSSSLVSEKM